MFSGPTHINFNVKSSKKDVETDLDDLFIQKGNISL
jgi:hypothetical protein